MRLGKNSTCFRNSITLPKWDKQCNKGGKFKMDGNFLANYSKLISPMQGAVRRRSMDWGPWTYYSKWNLSCPWIQHSCNVSWFLAPIYNLGGMPPRIFNLRDIRSEIYNSHRFRIILLINTLLSTVFTPLLWHFGLKCRTIEVFQ